MAENRIEWVASDAAKYVSSQTGRFDLIAMIRFLDPGVLRDLSRVLNPGGLMTMHLGSPVFQAATVQKNARNLRRVFRHVAPMALYIPLYGSLWCLGVASDTVDARALAPDTVAQRLRERRIGALKYYNPEVHQALFALPNFVRDLTADGNREPAKLAA